MSKKWQPPVADGCSNYRRLSKAELDQCLDALLAKPATTPQADELQQLLHELHVHQIELEIQNRELCEAQVKLEESYSRYANLYDFAPVGYLTLTTKGNIREINLRGCIMLERDRTQLIGMPLAAFLVQGESHILFKHLTQVFQTTGKIAHELTLKSAHQRPMAIRIESIAASDNTGNTDYCHSALIDISEQKQAELALRAEHAQTQHYLDAVGTIILALNKEGEISLINRKGCELLGYSEADLIGKNWFSVCLPQSEERTNTFKVFQSIVAGKLKGLEYHESSILNRAGEARLIAWHNSCSRDSSGQIIGSLSAGEDITERRQMESLLNQQCHTLKLMAQGASHTEVLENLVTTAKSVSPYIHCSVMLIDKKRKYLRPVASPDLPDYYTDSEHKIEDIACREAVLNGERIIITDIQNHPDCKACYKLAYNTGLHTCWAEPITSSNGVVLGLFISYGNKASNPTPSELELTQGLAHLAGIAIERWQSKALAQHHQAELTHLARLNIMGEMATGLAHELNQPLAAITAFTGAAMRMLQAGSQQPERLEEALQGAHDQAMRASEIIRHTRQLIQKRPPQRNATDLNSLIEQVIGFIQFEAQRRGVTVKLELDADLPQVTIDGIQIEQVLLNLLRNAIEAMPPISGAPQTVTIQTGLDSTGWAQVTVADTGHGMSKQRLSQLFKPFSTSKGSESMGMGLSICRSIMENHGGRLWAESRPGRGSKFHLTLPLARIPHPTDHSAK